MATRSAAIWSADALAQPDSPVAIHIASPRLAAFAGYCTTTSYSVTVTNLLSWSL